MTPPPRLVPDRPSDYVLVPREPAEEMIDAAYVYDSGTPTAEERDNLKTDYRLMIAAAPPAGAPAERGDVPSINIPAALALCSSIGPDFRVIYRDAFRWKDEHGDVLPNHYECQSAPYIAEEHGHDLVLDLGYAAILRDKRPVAPPPLRLLLIRQKLVVN